MNLMEQTRRRWIFLSLGAADWARAQQKGAPGQVAMTTTTFTAWFEQTRPKGSTPARSLTLLEVPDYFASRFRCHNLEFWNKHFESQAPSYLADLKRKVQAAKSTLINIQIDAAYNLSDEDEAARRKSIDLIKSWIDTAAALGSKSLRANAGTGTVERCIESYRELKTYAAAKNVLLLTENHGGLSLNIDNLLRILNEVGKDNFQSIVDFGNFTGDRRYEDMKRILPFSRHLISAKATEIREDGTHPEFDFDRCMRIARESGFSGYYSAEYWAPKSKRTDYENIADWMLQHIRASLAEG